MSALDRLNYIIAAYGRLILTLFNFRLWPPYFLYFLLLATVALLLANQFASGMSWIIPLNVWIAGDSVLHYPQHLQFLPYSFERISVVISLLVESLFTAATVVMFAAHFRREKVRFIGSLREVLPHYLKILLIWLINFVLIYLLFMSLSKLFVDFVQGAPRRQLALFLGMRGLSVLVTCLFVYVMPYMFLRGRGLVAAFRDSIAQFFRSFFTTAIFVGLPQLLLLPLIYTLQSSDKIIDKFNPDLVVWLTVAFAFALNLANFFTTGAIVRFFIDYAED